tara:strand:- start:10749 stop:11423 length:675 start_codon:yes stop_codon:yes gene_type:complete
VISHTHKFIAIFPPKTGSTSLVSILLDYCKIKKLIEQKELNSVDFLEYVDDYNLDSWKRFTHNDAWKQAYGNYVDPNQPRKHASLSSYNESDIRNYKLFAAIRNPYDRLVSHWKWETRPTNSSYRGFSFKRWLNIPQFWWHTPQTEFIHSEHRDIDCVDLIRFENLQQDFDTVCNKIGIPKQQLPHKNKSKHKHYTEYYDDETREIVSKKFAKDIEYFGYEFGD